MSQDSFSLSHAMPRIGGVLLAAGRGRRFDPTGKRHKLLAKMGSGDTLVRTSVMQMLPWVARLTVVVGRHNLGVARELAGLPVRIVVCPQADAGPGASLRCGLATSLEDVERMALDGVLIGLADMPFIAPETYATLRASLCGVLDGTVLHAWRASFETQPGHPVAITAALARQYLQMPVAPHEVGKGLALLWRKQPHWLTEVTVADPGCVRDVDVPEDLASC